MSSKKPQKKPAAPPKVPPKKDVTVRDAIKVGKYLKDVVTMKPVEEAFEKAGVSKPKKKGKK